MTNEEIPPQIETQELPQECARFRFIAWGAHFANLLIIMGIFAFTAVSPDTYGYRGVFLLGLCGPVVIGLSALGLICTIKSFRISKQASKHVALFSTSILGLVVGTCLSLILAVIWSEHQSSVSSALTHRSTRTLPLRVTVRSFRAASAAPVNSIR